ncbi:MULTISPECIES: MaoC family dehydratase [Rhodomicrobium]|uniref:MaoC family dehydratase n=1 Tax=Rhodomicrobium TaxID=1068 RepID=UPI000B4B70F5|nr:MULTISPECIES: MaoC family dehydratase [Rhodomicrobium]
MVKVGDEIAKPYRFTLENIREFARLAGDENPLHSDPEFAAASRYGGIIASGPHMTAVLMGLVASRTTGLGDGVGLDFHVHFKKAIPAGTDTILTWKVLGIEPHAGLKGNLATLEGRIVDAAGKVYVTCEGRSVNWPAP